MAPVLTIVENIPNFNVWAKFIYSDNNTSGAYPISLITSHITIIMKALIQNLIPPKNTLKCNTYLYHIYAHIPDQFMLIYFNSIILTKKLLISLSYKKSLVYWYIPLQNFDMVSQTNKKKKHHRQKFFRWNRIAQNNFAQIKKKAYAFRQFAMDWYEFFITWEFFKQRKLKWIKKRSNKKEIESNLKS